MRSTWASIPIEKTGACAPYRPAAEKKDVKMATTVFFEETLKDAARTGNAVDFEIGRSSFLNGESLVYIVVDGKTLILDEAAGRRLCEAVDGLSSYLGYNR
jgi:hypothetical protein